MYTKGINIYANGQTLRHKKTNELVRLVPALGKWWAWNRGQNVTLIREDGTRFVDYIDNYGPIIDEFDRIYNNPPAEGQFVDESAKKYLVSKEKMAEMRHSHFENWEAKVLDRMDNGGPKPYVETKHGIKVTVYPRNSSDIAGKYIQCPFSDGSHSYLFEKFFLGRRDAKPLYRYYNSIHKKFTDGPSVFKYKGKWWIYGHYPDELTLIEEVE